MDDTKYSRKPKEEHLVPTTLSLHPKQLAKLEQLNENLGMSKSHLVRAMLNRTLDVIPDGFAFTERDQLPDAEGDRHLVNSLLLFAGASLKFAAAEGLLTDEQRAQLNGAIGELRLGELAQLSGGMNRIAEQHITTTLKRVDEMAKKYRGYMNQPANAEQNLMLLAQVVDLLCEKAGIKLAGESIFTQSQRADWEKFRNVILNQFFEPGTLKATLKLVS